MRRKRGLRSRNRPGRYHTSEKGLPISLARPSRSRVAVDSGAGASRRAFGVEGCRRCRRKRKETLGPIVIGHPTPAVNLRAPRRPRPDPTERAFLVPTGEGK